MTAINLSDRFTTVREALTALEHHEQAVSATVANLPKKSKIKVERSSQRLKISFPHTGGWIEFDDQYFEIVSYSLFRITIGEQEGEIADIEDISEGLIVRFQGGNLWALKITVGVDEYLLACPNDDERYWLIQTIRQWLGMEDGDREKGRLAIEEPQRWILSQLEAE